jgi:MshEN domain
MSGNEPFFEPFFLERPRLGDLLVRKGLITSSQLTEALAESEESRELLGRVLLRRGYLFEGDLARTLAEQLKLPYVDVHVVGVNREVAGRLPIEEGRRAAAIPVAVFRGRVRVVFADPSDEVSRSIVERYIPADTYEVAIAEFSAIDSAWSRMGAPRGGQ